MTVFVVFLESNWDDQGDLMDSIWSTRDAAESRCADFKKGRGDKDYDDAHISEVEIDTVWTEEVDGWPP